MAAIVRAWRRFALRTAVCAIFVVVVASFYWQTATNAAGTADIVEVFRRSGDDTATYAVSIPLNSLPRTMATWPEATGACSSEWDAFRAKVSPDSRKALPILPGVPFENDYEQQDSLDTEYLRDEAYRGDGIAGHDFNKSGVYRNTQGNCEKFDNPYSGLNAGAIRDKIGGDLPWAAKVAVRALRNGGGCALGDWEAGYTSWFTYDPCIKYSADDTLNKTFGFGYGGYEISPEHFNGWGVAQDYDVHDPKLLGWWHSGEDIEIRRGNPEYNGCELDSTDCWNGTEWIAVKMNNDKNYDGLPDDGGSYQYDGEVKGISGSRKHDLTDYLDEMYANGGAIRDGLDFLLKNGYLNPDSVAGKDEEDNLPVGEDGHYKGLGLYSNGMSLFRTELSLDKDKYNRIKSSQIADPDNAGLFMDIVADDYFSLFVNGCPVERGSNVWNAAKIENIKIPSTYLHGPDNICANIDTGHGHGHGYGDGYNPNKDPTQPNVIAIEVMDRIQIGRNWHDIGGTGLGFALVRRDINRYDLTPQVSTGSSYVNPGGSAVFTYDVKNVGVDSRDTSYMVRNIVVPHGVSLPDGFFTGHDDATCATYAVGRITCSGATTAPNGSRIFPSYKTTNVGSETVETEARYEPGTMICRVLVVQPRSTDSDGSRDSVPACVTVAKAPQVQFWGDDVTVGNSYRTRWLNDAAAVVTTRQFARNGGAGSATFGSWAEYGIFAPAVVKSVSGGAISGATGYIGTGGPITDADANNLTFANMGGDYGKWSSPRLIKESVEQFAKQYPEEAVRNGASVPLNSISINQGEIKRVPLNHGGNISIRGTYSGDGTAILVTDQTVIIDGDITVAQHTIKGIGTAPQLIIIANNIIVDRKVKHIDAWLVARPSDILEPIAGPNGKISTCDSIQPGGNYTNGLKLGECDQPLQINGALIAKEVQFRRTYGADLENGLATPAEVINLRADAFMWAHAGGSGMPIDTDFTVELPPRY